MARLVEQIVAVVVLFLVMGGYIWLLAMTWIAVARIAKRAGFPARRALLLLIPIANVFVLWNFSKAKWPAYDGPSSPTVI